VFLRPKENTRYNVNYLQAIFTCVHKHVPRAEHRTDKSRRLRCQGAVRGEEEDHKGENKYVKYSLGKHLL
jgi:hypothetical protein